MKLALLTCVFICILKNTLSFDPNAVSHTSKNKLKESIEAGEELLIYFYTNFDECPKCKQLMPDFQEAAGYLDNLEDGKVKSYKLATKFPEYGITTFPQLVLFLGNIPFKYDKTNKYDPDDILDWVEEAKLTPLPELNDETFEHLTQLSTGATTGDWLLLFASKSRPECMKPQLGDVATIAARLRGRKNVATIDTSTNRKVAKRFDLDPENHCSKYMFVKKTEVPMKHARGNLLSYSFHRTDLYEYTGDVNANSIIQFMKEGYATETPVPIPAIVDKAEERMEGLMDGLQTAIADHIHSVKVVFFSGMGFGLFAVFSAVLFVLVRFKRKKLV